MNFFCSPLSVHLSCVVQFITVDLYVTDILAVQCREIHGYLLPDELFRYGRIIATIYFVLYLYLFSFTCLVYFRHTHLFNRSHVSQILKEIYFLMGHELGLILMMVLVVEIQLITIYCLILFEVI